MRIIVMLCLAVAAGCAGMVKEPAMTAEMPAMAEPVPSVTAEVAPSPEPAPIAAVLPPAPVEQQKAARSSPPPASPEKLEKPVASATKPPAKTPPPATVAIPAVTFDMTALKARLKDTQGIGVLTKLALKNQMDDLLKQMRASHATKTSVAPLRQLYDNLIVKAVSVLHDGDPGLSQTIAQSREAIWDILADPVRFHAAS
jgi:hypothetical protein